MPTEEVRAIGLKLVGEDGSDFAEGLAISLTAANFHTDGTVELVQRRLKMLCKATRRAGHFLNTRYGIPSTGEGDDFDLDFFTA